MEQLLSAGIYNDILADQTNTLNQHERELIMDMAKWVTTLSVN